MTAFLKRHGWAFAYGAVILFTLAPLLATLLGTLLAPLFGCDTNGMNEGSAPDCPGGDVIYLLFVSSWYALVTLPLGAALLAFLGFLHLIAWYRRRKTV